MLFKCVLVFAFIGHISACPHGCGKNEVYSQCTGHCEGTCDNPHPACPYICQSGCICRPGYLRNTATGLCVPADSCPCKTCRGPNEVFSRCRGHCGGTCDRPNPPCPRICKSGCICKDGYLRNTQTGKCIPAENCPCRKCYGANEEYSHCRGHCDTHCNDLPDKICHTACIPGCICKKGYARDSRGHCIPIKNCIPKCGKNEQYTECGTACPDTCDDWRTPTACIQVCVPGCFCLPGYVRNTKTNECVRPCECPYQEIVPY
ncbi:zonadhesin-like [Arctopsyche grandis]|uniref:zonadhesin-like n=1 Tax=Arctopsyche grandis TaxID=121162 RepID=UPI00406D696C